MSPVGALGKEGKGGDDEKMRYDSGPTQPSRLIFVTFSYSLDSQSI